MKVFFLTLLGLLVLYTNANPIDTNELPDDDDDDKIDLSMYGSRIFGTPSEEVGKRVENYNPDIDGNPEELGSYLEGDMLNPNPQQRNALVAESSKWQNGVVPFVISGSFNANQMQMIEDAFNEYKRKTCIRFIPRTSERDYISIENANSGCWSSVGRVGGKQSVNVQTPGCMTKIGTIIHELMHALGFYHEQNRSERDSHVSIVWGNIKRGTEGNFEKLSSSSSTAYGVPYDYSSVMHYSSKAFSVNGQDTIIPKRGGGSAMGQRNGFSSMDLQKINIRYGCSNGNNGNGPSAFGPGPNYNSNNNNNNNWNGNNNFRPERPGRPNRPNNQFLNGVANFLINALSKFTQGDGEVDVDGTGPFNGTVVIDLNNNTITEMNEN